MHLAIVSPYPPNITGIGQYGYHISRMFAQSGVFARITVLNIGAADLSGLQSAIEIKQMRQPGSLYSGLRIASELKRLQPDLVWFNLGASAFGRTPLENLAGFFSPLLARALGFPTVVTLHELVELADLRLLQAPGGALAPVGARLLTRIALQADVVCLTMRRYVDWLATHHGSRQNVYIPIGAYHEPELLPESAEREILFFTTLAPFKGLEILLQAFERVRVHYPEARLTVAGAEHVRFPGYARKLRESFKGLARVRWLGQVPESQVRELFQKAQVVCIPYTASTGSSSVLYQAAAWGRSLVASDLPEAQVVARESGLDVAFFASGDVDSLTASLKTLLDSPERRRAQVTANFAAIQKNRPEDICRAYLQAFNLALETRRSPKRLAIPARRASLETL